jgi:hypothetical protein
MACKQRLQEYKLLESLFYYSAGFHRVFRNTMLLPILQFKANLK